MLHLGDITKISGYTAPIVDCIVGGSPCQDLSIAGKRAGLDGERSGLFMDQVRIVKEMRDRDVRENGKSGVAVRPRYLVWENVPGAFSSNKGEDFRIVLEEIAKVKDKDAVIPRPEKWQTSGCILGDGWSIAWRILDAQFWGVPQRRRRIALVADFGGHSASEILFVSEGVSGHPQPSESEGKAVTHDAERGSGADDIYCIDGDKLNKKERSGGSGIGYREGNQYTLTAKDVHGVAYSQPVYSVENHPADSRVDIDDTGKVQTLTSRMGTGGGNVPMVMEKRVFESHPVDSRIKELGNISPTVTSKFAKGCADTPLVMESIVFSKSKRAQTPTDYETWQESDTANTLNTFDQGDVRTNECVIALDRASYNQGKNAQFDIGISESGTAQSLVAKGPGAVCYTVDQGAGKSSASVLENASPTLACTHDGAPAVCYDTIGAFYPQMKAESTSFRTDGICNCLVNGTNPGFQNGLAIASVDCRNGTEDITNGALQSMASNNINSNNVVRTRYTVRRLTPLECERLQGYPDGWTDIGEYTDTNGKTKKSSDAARYKALGNSIAIPPWKWVMKRLCACYERDATLASLFSGIGGFDLIWTQLNGYGSVLWESEIENFPSAVCKRHFGDEATGERGDFYEAILGRDTKTNVGEC